jgi:hypothetical protein
MAQTLCIKCGSELKPSSYCHLCQEPLNFACTSCSYITEEKDSIVDKPKEETDKAEPPSAPSYMTRDQDNKKFNNPFIVGTAIWQTSMKYWLDAYGEFLKNAPKMAEDWYDIFFKPWLNWTPQEQERQDRYKVNIE